jgi:hypothetical protein
MIQKIHGPGRPRDGSSALVNVFTNLGRVRASSPFDWSVVDGKWAVMLLCGIVVAGCASRARPRPAPNITSPGEANGQAAAELSDAQRIAAEFVQELLSDRIAAFERMERRFRASYTQRSFEEAWKVLATTYGEPLVFEYKSEARGHRDYLDGAVKPATKIWFATGTTTHPKGQCFAFVEVVPDGDRLAIAEFAIVTFPMGVPPWLE